MSRVLASLRRLCALALAFAMLASAAVPALADQAADRKALDGLFAELRVAPDASAAHAIDEQIWRIWTSPSDETLRLRMLDVMEARSFLGADKELALLDALIADYPGYAEGWNQRATLYYMLGNYEASLADIERTLALEPRHFGALAGRVLIYLAQGKRSEALKDMVNALAIHPFLTRSSSSPSCSRG